MKKFLLASLAALCFCLSSSAQNETVDSLVSLISAQSAQLIEKRGVQYRKVTGPARFFHNNTYLICDTALWNIKTDVIDAIGHVKILQNETVLTGDSLRYIVAKNLAQFRGHLVQLQDRERNTLRTRHMDYNTKDSVGIFAHGGSLRDKEGQIIESVDGKYDAKIKTFTFSKDVNMFTDSIFVKTSKLDYNTKKRFATFGKGTDAWRDDNMLSSDAGWYDRTKELFLFNRKVHALTPNKEAWSDSLFYYRNSNDVDVRGNAQLTDEERKVSALAGRIVYTDSLDKVEMTKRPAIIAVTDTTRQAIDTVYMSGEVLTYRTQPRYKMGEREENDAKTRIENLKQDAVSTYRRKAAEAAAKAAEEAKKNQDMANGIPGKPGAMGGAPPAKGGPPGGGPGAKQLGPQTDKPGKDNAAPPSDTTAMAMADSTSSAVSDSLAAANAPKDTTKINIMTALRNVRMYREDLQVVCDSLEYTDLDSLFRLYKQPFVWNEGYRQYTADSIFVVVKNNAIDKADLLSNAFIIAREDSLCYDQIKSSEMLAYFNKSGGLRRYDALGDADAILYVKEDSVYATLNKTKAKMLYAVFEKGQIENVYYFEEVKTDAYPIAQMRMEDRTLKGFDWRPSMRPKSPKDITTRTLRETQRKSYESHPKAQFKQTDIYFPGYMADVYRQIAKKERQKAVRDSLAAIAPPKPKDVPVKSDSSSVVPAVTDSVHTGVPIDSLAAKANLPDSLSGNANVKAPSDTTASVSSTPAPTSPKDIKKAEREARRNAKTAAKEAKWASKDAKDAAKAKAKAEKKAAKLRAKKLKALQDQQKREEQDQKTLEAYMKKYLKEKKEQEANPKKARKSKGKKGSKGDEAPETSTTTTNLQETSQPSTTKTPSDTLPMPGTPVAEKLDSLVNEHLDSLSATPVVQEVGYTAKEAASQVKEAVQEKSSAVLKKEDGD